MDALNRGAARGRRYARSRLFRFSRVWVWALVAVLAGACGFPAGGTPEWTAAVASPAPTSTPTATSTSTPTPSATPTVSPTSTQTPVPLALNPLTGLPVEDESLMQRRPIAVKVSNYPRTARPQYGLSYADLLFEFYQEYGMTRFHAVFLSRDVEKVGPIRSGRKIDARLQQAYQSFLTFNAADVKVWDFLEIEDVKKWILYEGPVTEPALFRDSTKAQINSLFGNTAELRNAAMMLKKEDIVPDLTGMVFQAEPPVMSGSAATVRVRFLTNFAIAEWRYNPSDEKYYRYSETDDESGEVAPLTDRLTGEQLAVSNLVIVYVNFVRRQKPEMYEVELFGNGKALFFRNGKMETGVWRMPRVDRPLQFYGPDGPFYLHPGVTWIALVEDSSTELQEGDTVRIQFEQPAYGGG
jgi:hypothetical protein